MLLFCDLVISFFSLWTDGLRFSLYVWPWLILTTLKFSIFSYSFHLSRFLCLRLLNHIRPPCFALSLSFPSIIICLFPLIFSVSLSLYSAPYFYPLHLPSSLSLFHYFSLFRNLSLSRACETAWRLRWVPLMNLCLQNKVDIDRIFSLRSKYFLFDFDRFSPSQNYKPLRFLTIVLHELLLQNSHTYSFFYKHNTITTHVLYP